MIVKRFVLGFITGVITMGAITIGAEIFAEPIEPEIMSDNPDVKEQLQKPVECYNSESVLQVSDKRGYTVFWQGNNLKDDYPDNTIVILTNNKTNAYMAIEMNSQVACILGYGGSFWLFEQYYPNLGDNDAEDQSSN
jgi:hypothetical protein